MSARERAMTIEELESALAALVDNYVASLSHARPKPVTQVRIEAMGEGVSVMYDRNAPDGMPTLNVQIIQGGRRR